MAGDAGAAADEEVVVEAAEELIVLVAAAERVVAAQSVEDDGQGRQSRIQSIAAPAAVDRDAFDADGSVVAGRCRDHCDAWDAADVPIEEHDHDDVSKSGR